MSDVFDRGRSFYATPFWRELSAQCRRRDGHRCRRCGHQAATSEERGRMHAHHRTSRPPVSHATALDSLGNLETLCVDCHGKQHGRSVGAARPGAPKKLFRASRPRRGRY